MLLLDHTCDIERQTAVGTNGRHSRQTVYSGVSCLFLPMNHTTTIELGFSLGRAYDAYFDNASDVQPDDRLVFNGQNFIVKAVQPFSVNIVGHIHAMCEQEIA